MKTFKGTKGSWKIGDANQMEASNVVYLPKGKSITILLKDVKEAEANAKLIASAPELLEALQYYNNGVDHFYKCIDFGKSNLDAKAIKFMNDSNIKIKKAINKAL